MTSRDLLRIVDDLIPQPDGAPPPTLETVQVIDGPDVDGLYTVEWAGAELDRVPSIAALSAIDVPARALATAGGLLILGSPGAVGGGGTSAYTPELRGTTTDPFIGAGTAVGTWSAAGHWVDVDFEIVLGTGFTAGAGAYQVTMPVALDCAAHTPVGLVHLLDASDSGDTGRRVWALTKSATADDRVNIRGTGDTQSRFAAPTVPWTWAAGDSLLGQARFRIGILVPQQAPTLANIESGNDSTTVTTRDIGLSTGTADKMIVLHELQGNSTTITVPDGWELAGPNPITQNQHAVLYRSDTSAETLTLTTNGASRRLHWWTMDVIDGDLDGLLVAHSSQVASATQTFSTTAGGTTSWRGVIVCSQFGTMTAPGAAPTTWPADLADDRHFASFTNTLSTNDFRAALASGAFIATTTVDPDSLVWDESQQRAGLTIAIPRAVV